MQTELAAQVHWDLHRERAGILALCSMSEDEQDSDAFQGEDSMSYDDGDAYGFASDASDFDLEEPDPSSSVSPRRKVRQGSPGMGGVRELLQLLPQRARNTKDCIVQHARVSQDAMRARGTLTKVVGQAWRKPTQCRSEWHLRRAEMPRTLATMPRV